MDAVAATAPFTESSSRDAARPGSCAPGDWDQEADAEGEALGLADAAPPVLGDADSDALIDGEAEADADGEGDGAVLGTTTGDCVAAGELQAATVAPASARTTSKRLII